MDRDNKKQGVVILGLPRSGSTLVRRLLNAHSNITCPGETNLFGSAARFLRSDSFAGSVPTGVSSSLTFLGFESNEVLDRVREFLFQFHRDHAARQDKPRWADKSPLDIFYLEDLKSLLLGHVHFICLHRHALDFTISLQEFCSKAGGYYSEIHQYIKRHQEPLHAFARIWADKSRQMLQLQQQHPTDVVSLRYEDLVDEPEAEMTRILNAIGEPWEPGIVNRALENQENLGLGDWKTYSKTKIDRSSIGRWNQLLPRQVVHSLRPIVSPMLQELRYPPIEGDDVEPNPDSSREYEIGLMIQKMRQSTR